MNPKTKSTFSPIKWVQAESSQIYDEEKNVFIKDLGLFNTAFTIESQSVFPNAIIEDRTIFSDLWLTVEAKVAFHHCKDALKEMPKQYCVFAVENHFPARIETVEYVLCDADGDRIDSLRYRACFYDSKPRFVLSAFLPDNVNLRDVHFCILQVSYHPNYKYYTNYTSTGPFFSHLILAEDTERLLNVRKLCGLPKQKSMYPSNVKEPITKLQCFLGYYPKANTENIYVPFEGKLYDDILSSEAFSGVAFEELQKALRISIMRNEKPPEYDLTLSCMYRYWNSEKNKGVDPTKYSIKSRSKMWYTCPDGKDIRIMVAALPDTLDCKREQCSNCIYDLCPYIEKCNENCHHLNTALTDFVEGRYQLPYEYREFTKYLGRSPVMIQYIKKLVEGKLEKDQQQRMERLLLKDNGWTYSSKILFSAVIDNQLEVLKELGKKYPSVMFYVKAIAYDIDNETREQIVDYYRWAISNKNVFAVDLYGFLFYSDSSADLNNLLISMLKEEHVKNKLEKEDDTTVDDHINSFIRDKHLKLS